MLVAALSVILISGCSVFAEKPQFDHGRVEQFAGHGYDSGIYYQTSTRSSSADGADLQFVLVQPVPQGSYPLIIYLPGLGESDQAGAALRDAWARSGYAVLSLQPQKRDSGVWSSGAARSRDYTYLRHQMYDSAIVSERLGRLAGLAEYLQQQAASGGADVRNMDLSRVAITGFDIGAYTAMIAAGEAPQNVAFAGLKLPVRAVIALSPYADFTGADFEIRYRNIHLPVLSVSSDADSDMHGSVPPSLHQAPFRYMPAGDKYLLLLTGAPHAAIGAEDLSGSVADPNKGEQDESVPVGSGGSPTRHAMTEIALEQTTTAFLNAYVKHDRYSLDWLANEAQPWLGELGRLRYK